MDEPLGRRLALTAKAISASTDAVLAQHGASLTTWIVLHHVATAPATGLSQKKLADSLSIGGPAVVRHIDRLEAEGFVRRTRDEHDRRITRITITAKGKRRIQKLRVVMDQRDQAMRAELTAAELKTLERALDRLSAFASRSAADETDTA